MDKLRSEPFRLLFPLSALAGWLAVLPWVLFAGGVQHAWPGLYHALAMTQGFLPAVAAGFLGTMLPRRTGTAPMSAVELFALVIAFVALPACLAAGALAASQLIYLAVLVLLGRFALVRLRARPIARRSPPLFLFLPAGALAGGVGAALLFAFALTGDGALLQPGRTLAEEGLLLALVLAIAPLLTPSIAHGAPVHYTPPTARTLVPWIAAVVAYLASFALEFTASVQGGLLLRGAVLGLCLLAAGRGYRVPTTPGLHRRVYYVALLLIPAGLLATGVLPSLRLPLLHVTFVGGLSLLVFAVSFHVAFLHTGRDALAVGRPWPPLAVAGLTLAATAVRTGAERFGSHYFAALGVAASLWLVADGLWGVTLLGLLTRRPAGTAGGAA